MVCTSESCASPVPGGRSTMKQSSSPHSTSRENCWITFMIMGPRRSAPARDGDLHARDAGDGLDGLARVAREGARVLSGEQEVERHLSPVVHGEVLDHAGGDDVLRNAGVLDSREGALNAGAQRVGGGHARECTRA